MAEKTQSGNVIRFMEEFLTLATLRPNSTMPRQFSTPVEPSLTKPLVGSATRTFSQALRCLRVSKPGGSDVAPAPLRGGVTVGNLTRV